MKSINRIRLILCALLFCTAALMGENFDYWDREHGGYWGVNENTYCTQGHFNRPGCNILVAYVDGITLEEAKLMAESNPDISHFHYVETYFIDVISGNPNDDGLPVGFNAGHAAFFSGTIRMMRTKFADQKVNVYYKALDHSKLSHNYPSMWLYDYLNIYPASERKEVYKSGNMSLDRALMIADKDPNISYFFQCNRVHADDWRSAFYHENDIFFFSGEPTKWYNGGKGTMTVFIKTPK